MSVFVVIVVIVVIVAIVAIVVFVVIVANVVFVVIVVIVVRLRPSVRLCVCLIIYHRRHPSHLCQDPYSILRTFLEQFVLVYFLRLLERYAL